MLFFCERDKDEPAQFAANLMSSNGGLFFFANSLRSHSSTRCSLNDDVVRWHCFSIYVRYTTNGRLGHSGVMDDENIMTCQ